MHPALEKLLKEASEEHEAMWAAARKCPYRSVGTRYVRDAKNPLRVYAVTVRANELELLRA